ncbi:hypothetical protein GCM10019815_04690 [Pediococcus damnosus]
MHECLIGGVHVHDDALNRGPFCGAVLTKKELFDGSIKTVAKYFNGSRIFGVGKYFHSKSTRP